MRERCVECPHPKLAEAIATPIGLRYKRTMELDRAREYGVLPGWDRLNPIEWNDLCTWRDEYANYEAEPKPETR